MANLMSTKRWFLKSCSSRDRFLTDDRTTRSLAWQIRVGLFIFFTVLSLSVSSGSSSIAEAEPIELPSDIPPLPEQRETDRPLYISARNASIYHELLLAPVAQWFKEGRFVARVIRSLPFEFSLSATWNAQSDKYGESTTLRDAAPSTLPPVSALALPFGRAASIANEQNPRDRARKILWNLEYAALPNRDALYHFDFGWLSGSVRQRTASGYLLSRLAPSPENFRADRFEFLSPAVVAGHAQLSHRSVSGTEDLLWVHSSVSGKTRQVLDSNRGDPILGSLISMDDLGVFAGNIRAFDANVLEERTMLVPFATVAPLVLTSAPLKLITGAVTPEGSESVMPSALTAEGPYRTKSGENAFATWNADDGTHPQGAAWIPTSAVFVPRRVWVIELTKQDPYYVTGRQILVVDQESMLPVYKVIYDRRGVYARTIAAGWTIGLNEKSDFRAPILGFLVSVDRSLQAAAVFSSQSFQTLEGAGADIVEHRLESLSQAAAKEPKSNSSGEGRSPKTSNSEASSAATEPPDDEAPAD